MLPNDMHVSGGRITCKQYEYISQLAFITNVLALHDRVGGHKLENVTYA